MCVNFDGAFLGTRLGVEAMRSLSSRPRRCAGSIVNILSVLGILGCTEAGPYCASKVGVRLLTKTVALESAAKGWDIRINSIHPGFIWTPMVRETIRRSAADTGVDEKALRQVPPICIRSAAWDRWRRWPRPSCISRPTNLVSSPAPS